MKLAAAVFATGFRATAMGATGLKSLRYTGDGVGYTFGQAYKPGLAWPKIQVRSFARTVNYDTGSMRDEVVIQRAEALGGGGYPHTATQRNDQFVSGTYAWNQTGAGPTPGPRFVVDRVHQLWITPQGVLKAARSGRNCAMGKPIRWRRLPSRGGSPRRPTSMLPDWSIASNRRYRIRCSATRWW